MEKAVAFADAVSPFSETDMKWGPNFLDPDYMPSPPSPSSPATLTAEIFDEELLDSYSADELRAYIKQCSGLVTSRIEKSVVMLSPNLIAKSIALDGGQDYLDEVLAIERAQEAGIRVPTIRRLVRARVPGCYYMVMERIHGLTLEQLWREISWLDLFRAAWQLRSYLRILRSITSQTTGGLHSGRTHSEWFQDVRGPILHASPTVFTGYLNWWLTDCRPGFITPFPELALKPEVEHVLVHQDLAPRNMILDNNGRLWVVDWGHAGFYPAYLEYLGIEAQNMAMPWLSEQTWTAWWGCLRWSIFRWIAAGSSRQYDRPKRAVYLAHSRTLKFRIDRTPYSGDW